MGRCIAKLADNKYVEWSTIVDSPVTYIMTREEALAYRMQTQDKELAEMALERADKTGTSFQGGFGELDGLIACNRAGPNESQITLEEIIERFKDEESYKKWTPKNT